MRYNHICNVTTDMCAKGGGEIIKHLRKKQKNDLIKLGGVFTFAFTFFLTHEVIESLLVGFAVCFFVYLMFWVVEQQKRQELKASGIRDVDTMDGFQFEHYLVELFKSHNYSVKKTPNTNDFGADLLLKKDGKKIVVQAKRYKGNIGIKAVQEIIGAKSYYKAQGAWVVTNSKYTKSAIELARKSNVRLIDRYGLMKLQGKTNKVNPSKIKKEIKPKEKINCNKCGAAMLLRNGKKGVFYGCNNFPQCKNTKKA